MVIKEGDRGPATEQIPAFEVTGQRFLVMLNRGKYLGFSIESQFGPTGLKWATVSMGSSPFLVEHPQGRRCLITREIEARFTELRTRYNVVQQNLEEDHRFQKDGDLEEFRSLLGAVLRNDMAGHLFSVIYGLDNDSRKELIEEDQAIENQIEVSRRVAYHAHLKWPLERIDPRTKKADALIGHLLKSPDDILLWIGLRLAGDIQKDFVREDFLQGDLQQVWEREDLSNNTRQYAFSLIDRQKQVELGERERVRQRERVARIRAGTATVLDTT